MDEFFTKWMNLAAGWLNHIGSFLQHWWNWSDSHFHSWYKFSRDFWVYAWYQYKYGPYDWLPMVYLLLAITSIAILLYSSIAIIRGIYLLIKDHRYMKRVRAQQNAASTDSKDLRKIRDQRRAEKQHTEPPAVLASWFRR